MLLDIYRIFNKRVEPLLVAFKPEIRKRYSN